MPASRSRVPTAREYVIDGRRTTSLAAFYAEVGRALVGQADWGASAEALDRLLHDVAVGPQAARAGVRLVWRHAGTARAALGYPETVRQRLAELRDCAPNVLIRTAWALRASLRGTGPTVFDALVRQLEAHRDVTLVLRDDAGPTAAPGA
jgi:hypothetical protein